MMSTYFQAVILDCVICGGSKVIAVTKVAGLVSGTNGMWHIWGVTDLGCSRSMGYDICHISEVATLKVAYLADATS